ncbi:MAG: protease inhibitor I42 family protein [Acidobacteria bacterium]|nr:protease inhibitor I42 family protein [Acidobacteriota bacterium]MBS1865762.1 protease inhibitor I42 family protein [Acidobacteriota bacterium]
MADTKIEPKDFGKTIELSVDDTITLELLENPTTGFRWQISPDALVKCGDQFVLPTAVAAGQGGLRVLQFRATSRGTGVLKLQLSREWETAPPQRNIEIPYLVR